MNIIPQNFEGKEIRFVIIDDVEYAVGVDVARVLGYKDPSYTISKRVDQDYKALVNITTPSGNQDTTVITEEGIYQLIFSSKLDTAKKFQKWVFKEVLPSIRKTGKYEISQNPPEPKKAIAYYTDRVMDIRKNLKVPIGYWCVIQHCGQLLLEVERLGYPVDKYDLLDGSVGICWSNYRKEQKWTKPVQKATYDLKDKRGIREINAYEAFEIQYFVPWLENIYEIDFLGKYLQEKYGDLVKM